jgi:hypothetical protein
VKKILATHKEMIWWTGGIFLQLGNVRAVHVFVIDEAWERLLE